MDFTDGGIAANMKFSLALGVQSRYQMSGKLLFEYFLNLFCWPPIQLFGISRAVMYGR